MGMLPAPLSAWAEGDMVGVDYNGPVMLLGITPLGEWVGITDDGRMRYIPTHQITVDWRYDWKQHEWIEVNGITQELEDDGGADLPGSVHDADGGSGGDSFSEEGREATGDSGDLETNEATAGQAS